MTTKKYKTKIKTEWNLGLLYKNEKDPQIEADVRAVEKAYREFEDTYKKHREYLKHEDALLTALKEYETLAAMSSSKSVRYFYYRKDLNSADQTAESMLNKLSDRLTKAYNNIIFFELSIGKIPEADQQKILKNKNLEHFHYFLELIFKNAKYTLSEAEEKILNLKSLPSYSMWVDSQEKNLYSKSVTWKGKELPLPQAMNMISVLPTKDRRKLHDEVMKVLQSASQFAESEINAVYTDKKIDDELRGHQKPYSATILGYQNDEKSVMNLVDTVTNNFSICNNFYALKTKLMKENYLEYADRAAKIGKTEKVITFEQGLSIVRKAFGKAGEKYVSMLNKFLANGQIDVYPKKGKTGGAYCSSSTGIPTFVLLNNSDSFRSVMTIGHEMGHAFHSELSKSQTPLYQGYVTSVAEVASTLFENFVFEEMFETLNDKEKIIALHDRINDDVATIFRQIACFNFELELHEQIRAKGALSKEEIAAAHNKHMKAYLGPKFKMKDIDGYFFVNWSHIRRFFYVYSYSYGQIISKALYKKFKENPDFMREIEKFLSAGGSKSPEDIFKDIGIDVSKPEFFEQGLKSVEEDIKRLEKLAKEAKMI
jgi:oligoendopeptidase F